MSEMINMSPPWPAATDEDIYRNVAQGERPQISDNRAAECPDGWCELMHQCWDQDPANRPAFAFVHEQLCHIQGNLSSGHALEPPDQALQGIRIDNTQEVDMETYYSLL